MTQCYHYDAETGTYLSITEDVDESPLEPGVYRPPAHATLVPPPEAGPHQIAVFDEINGVWSLIADWRGVDLFSTIDDRTLSIRVLGLVPADIGATEHPMPGPEYSWREGAWVFDPEKAAALFQQAKMDAVSRVHTFLAAQRASAAGTDDAGELLARMIKRAAAEAVAAGSATEAQMLNLGIEAQLRGMSETPEQLAQKIVEKAIALDAVNAKLDGLKRAAENALLATATADDLRDRTASLMDQIAAVAADRGAVET